MSTIDELAATIREQLDADELWATEASRHDENPVVEGGEHWHWQCSGHDIDVEPKPGLSEYLETGQCECFRIGLRSIEEYPTMSVGDLPHLLFGAECVPSAAGGHIERHDPARVLRDVAAKRALLEQMLTEEHHRWPGGSACAVIIGSGDCNCGRDDRVAGYLRLLAQAWQEGPE